MRAIAPGRCAGNEDDKHNVTKPSWRFLMNCQDEETEAQRDKVEDPRQAAASIEGTGSALGGLGLDWVILSCRLGDRLEGG